MDFLKDYLIDFHKDLVGFLKDCIDFTSRAHVHGTGLEDSRFSKDSATLTPQGIVSEVFWRG